MRGPIGATGATGATGETGIAGAIGPAGADTGNMGLKGLWALIGNSTAMVILAVVLFVVIFMVKEMHKEGMNTLERMNQNAVDGHGKMLDSMRGTLDRNTSALDDLSKEIRWMRKQHKD